MIPGYLADRTHGTYSQNRYLGVYPDQLTAAKAIATAVGCTIGALRKRSQDRTTAAEQIDRFRVLYTAYDGELPGDLQHGAQMRILHADMVTTHPLLWSFIVRGKEGPWQAQLIKLAIGAFRSRAGTRGADNFMRILGSDLESASAHAAIFHGLLAGAATNLCDVDRSLWTHEVNAGVSHHSGWIPLLRYYKVLRFASVRDRARHRLCFGDSSRKYMVNAYDQSVHLELYQRTARICVLLRAMPIPMSLDDWSTGNTMW
jgi:hypothetical protein